MSERYATWIEIGGNIDSADLGDFIQAICKSCVRLNWGEPYFSPKSDSDITESQDGKWLQFCDDEAKNGEFTELESICRSLNLSYRRYTEASYGSDAEVVNWRIGMENPIRQITSSNHSDILVPQSIIIEALALIAIRQIKCARELLRQFCPYIDPLPAFKLTSNLF